MANTQWILSVVYDARLKHGTHHLTHVKAQTRVQGDVADDFMSRLKHLESRLQAATKTYQPIIDAIKRTTVEANKII